MVKSPLRRAPDPVHAGGPKCSSSQVENGCYCAVFSESTACSDGTPQACSQSQGVAGLQGEGKLWAETTRVAGAARAASSAARAADPLSAKRPNTAPPLPDIATAVAPRF